MTYIDGFVLPVPTKNIEAYRAMSEKAGKIWKEYGALQYRECVAEDMGKEMFKDSFVKAASAKEDETVIFAYIVYKSREHRDEVNAKVMADPRLKESCDPDNMPFDCTRMAYGGFTLLVDM